MKMIGIHITRCFPHLNAKGKTGGSSTSPYWLLLLALFALPATSSEHQPSEQQINVAIQQYLEALMRPTAQREGWQGMRITHTSTPLGSSRQVARCNQPPVVSGGSRSDTNRQRLTLTCPDQPGWALNVNTDVQILLPVLATTRVINRGEVITQGDLKRQEIDINKAPRGFYHRPDQVTGMGAKRRIRANQVLSPTLIALPLAVKRGDKVNIVATQDGISASMSGEAISNGAEGEVIRVKNISSGKTIDAKIIAPGVVTSIF
jgi:flagella basal body P-ring formation protein FlgA